MSKEGITQKGVGVEYKKVVSTRSDKAGTGGDGLNKSMSGVKQAFNKSCMDSKKA